MAPDDSTPTRWIDRRDYLKLSGGLAAGSAFGLAGCTGDGTTGDGSGDGATATGYLSTSVTDQPTDIGDFESCVVTLDGVWLGPRSDQSGGDDGTEGGEDGDDSEEADGDDSDEEEADDEETEEDGTGDEETDDGNQTTTQSTSASLASGSQPDDEPGNQGGGANETDGDEDGDEETDDGEDSDADGDSDDGDGDDGEDGDGNGRTYYAFDEPQEADLVDLQGENTQLVDDREVPVGTYQFLQLDVAGVEGVLVDGGEATVETPGNAPLKFQESFDVREGYRTSFTADFAPVKRGNGSYLIKPVASGTEVSYEPVDGAGSEESDDGGDETEDGSDQETTDGDGSTNGTATDGNETATDGGDTANDDGE